MAESMRVTHLCIDPCEMWDRMPFHIERNYGMGLPTYQRWRHRLWEWKKAPRASTGSLG